MTTGVPVLCFPPAGAGPSFFQAWPAAATALRFTAVELPGKERRFAETPATTMAALLDAIAEDVLREVGDAGRVGVFGHSFGARVAYEVARLVARERPAVELTLFASGAERPGIPRPAPIAGLPDDEFVIAVAELAGYRHPAMDDPDLRELLLPALRGDIAVDETHRPAEETGVGFPIVAVRGDADELVSAAAAARWAEVTSAGCTTAEIPGGHMYLVERWRPLVALLERTLAGEQARS
ncbi:thioesterase II family protein [Amycolatopsis sp. NBC_00438]|uniref:thioesterase II family protein n=1 Tax=Amycolatopsis sp. NBC_00438 TaxID=2903558 RepID=UPI002E1A643D